jgi:RNA polymerase sigma-54 factor
MYQYQDQSLRPLTTAHLAQTMSLLVLSNVELRDKVLSELSTNPALELLDERKCPGCQRPLRTNTVCPVCSRKQEEEGGPIVFLSPRDSIRPSRKRQLEDQPLDREPAAPEDLTTYVMRQLAAELLPEDRRLALYVLASLDEDGFLNDPPAIIAQATRCSLAQVKRVIELINAADPIGLATEGPKQALLVQLNQLSEDNPICDLARRMLNETFSALGRREYDKISHELEVKPSDVREASRFIQENLNPYPARAYWGSGRQPAAGEPNVYHTPDIMVMHNPNEEQGPLVVEIFSPMSGWLRVNPLFRQAMENASKDQADEWSEQLEKANLFVKCIQQRNNTMRRLMQLLVSQQEKFILEGPRYLKPMTRAEIAEHVGVHESTISRAVANKSVALPDGRIIPLAKFFDRSLSVRDRIKEIIRNETDPLTDDQIVALLKKDGVKIARRTVAKYRSIEGILPARLRGEQKLSQAA